MQEQAVNTNTPVPAEVHREVKKTKVSKREEKLNTLKLKRDKALSVQSAAEKKTNDINAQIAKLESDIHNDEVKALDAVCAERNVTYKDITDFISALPEGVTLSEAAEILKK